MAEKFYDVPGAARVLGLKDETMRRWLRSGKVRGLRLGRDWRISERALDELAHQATNQPTNLSQGGENNLAKALAMVQARDNARPASRMRVEGVNDAASELRQIREEQTP